tara:strand:+ start:533 stop:874 length:342 start_codon:yes stop_codon:yes gene_type:complete
MIIDNKPNSFFDKMRKGQRQTVNGINNGIKTGKDAFNGTVDGVLEMNNARKSALISTNRPGGSGYSSLYSTPIIKHGGKKNRRRKRKTRRRKRKTKRRTKRRRRTSKRRKRRR